MREILIVMLSIKNANAKYVICTALGVSVPASASAVATMAVATVTRLMI